MSKAKERALNVVKPIKTNNLISPSVDAESSTTPWLIRLKTPITSTYNYFDSILSSYSAEDSNSISPSTTSPTSTDSTSSTKTIKASHSANNQLHFSENSHSPSISETSEDDRG
jgi:hypothetical protein